MKPTHALVLDAVVGNTVTAFELCRGSKTKVLAEHKKWLAKIKRTEWISIPEDLPLTIHKSNLAAIRVISIPAEVHRAEEIEKKWAGDPRKAAYMKQFLNNAEPQPVEEGADILDNGYTR